MLALFLAREATAKTPLIPLAIFKARNLTAANVVQVLAVPGMFGLFFLGSLYLERVLGYDPLEIGFAFLPATLLMGILSARYTEPLSTRFGAKRLVIIGPDPDRRRLRALHPHDRRGRLRRPSSCRRWWSSGSAPGSPSPR